MAKRFTDTDKWKKPFIRSMKAPYKLLWLYILDECNHAGIWQVDFEVAQIKIGEKLILTDALKNLGEKIYPFSDGEKWFIPDFIYFQYGNLNPENRAHNSVIQLLTKYKLLDEDNKPLTSPLQGAMDMDKNKVKEKDKDKEESAKDLKRRYGPQQNILLTDVEFKKLEKDYPGLRDKAINYLSNWGKEKPKQFKEYKDHNLTIRRWVIDAVRVKEPEKQELKSDTDLEESVKGWN